MDNCGHYIVLQLQPKYVRYREKERGEGGGGSGEKGKEGKKFPQLFSESENIFLL